MKHHHGENLHLKTRKAASGRDLVASSRRYQSAGVNRTDVLNGAIRMQARLSELPR
jgi:hypothetical protein